jgi:carboxypeptidase Q
MTEHYRKAASAILGRALTDLDGMNRLVHLCDSIGARLAGSKNLERAVQWSSEEMAQIGLKNIETPAVKVPHWIRGEESAVLLEPSQRELPMLGLGGSVATPAEGITAEVVPVRSFEDLEALGEEKVRGKIVLYNVPFETYGSTVRYRVTGAARAAELGAVASLVRSITPVSLQTPHTGGLRYPVGAERIPAAAITIEDAEMLTRLAHSGESVRVRLRMQARFAPDADSANVVGEIPGREQPDEIVVFGGHLDSWDVGQGAHDDGVGCMASLQAAAILSELGFQPRRTLRLALWTNEENGLRGARAYRAWSETRPERHVAAIEMDGGAERPVGFGLGIRRKNPSIAEEAYSRALPLARSIGSLLGAIEAGEIYQGGGGADIGPLMTKGVPGLGLRTVGEKYFHWHHTHADTVDKVALQDFRKCIACMAVMAYVLADMPETLTV